MLNEVRQRLDKKYQIHPEEFEQISRFIRFLEKTEVTSRWQIADCDIKADDHRHDFDFLLKNLKNQRLMAVEESLLLESDRAMQERRKMMDVIRQVRNRLGKVEVDTFTVLKIPFLLNMTGIKTDSMVEEIVQAVIDRKDKLTDDHCHDFFVRGINFQICRLSYVHQLPQIQVYPILNETVNKEDFLIRLQWAIEHNNIQLNTKRADRRVMVLSDQFLVKAGYKLAIELIKKLPNECLLYTDEIYYEPDKPGEFHLIYQK